MLCDTQRVTLRKSSDRWVQVFPRPGAATVAAMCTPKTHQRPLVGTRSEPDPRYASRRNPGCLWSARQRHGGHAPTKPPLERRKSLQRRSTLPLWRPPGRVSI
jgi:hypothetical protein